MNSINQFVNSSSNDVFKVRPLLSLKEIAILLVALDQLPQASRVLVLRSRLELVVRKIQAGLIKPVVVTSATGLTLAERI